MTRSYVPSKVKVRLFGFTLKGLSKDTFVTIERVEDATRFRKAQDGQHIALVDKYGSYRVTLSFDQTSPSNEVLHLVYKLYQKAGVNLKIPLEIEEQVADGGTTFTSFETFFEGEATTEFGSDTAPKQWVLMCHNASYIQKGTVGNASILNVLQGIVQAIELAGAFGVDLTSIQDQLGEGFITLNNKLKDLI